MGFCLRKDNALNFLSYFCLESFFSNLDYYLFSAGYKSGNQ